MGRRTKTTATLGQEVAAKSETGVTDLGTRSLRVVSREARTLQR